VDDPDGPEWNFTAVSHKKRDLSGQLISASAGNSRRRPAPLRPGQWYPGEPLPAMPRRYRRKDGVRWKDDDLIADEARNYGRGPKEAKESRDAHRERVGVNPRI